MAEANPYHPLRGWRRACERVGDGCALVADTAGHVAAFVLLLLTLSIVLGITLRWIRIDNSWTYDLDLFTLVWTAFAGAVYTSLRGHHVTAGIALENMLGGRATVLSIIRFVIMVGFLILLTVSGYQQAHVSLLTHKTTLDVSEWPVWIAQASLPVGAALWAVAETAKFLRQMARAGEKRGGLAPQAGKQVDNEPGPG